MKLEWADYMLYIHAIWCAGIVWEPTREASSHVTRQGTLGNSCLSSLRHCELILV